MNREAQGWLLVEALERACQVTGASTAPQGREAMEREVQAIRENFIGLFKEVKQQKAQLEVTVVQWREYKDEYERLSDWLQQMDILVKAHKTALVATLPEKVKQVVEMKEVLDRLEKGSEQIETFNQTASVLLTSHLDTYVNNQLRHLNSRYQVMVNLAKDVMKKLEACRDQHTEYMNCMERARSWIDNAWEVIRSSAESGSERAENFALEREALQTRLDKIQELMRKREDGQTLVHATVNAGEKALRNTKSEGRDQMNRELKELQNDWDRLIRKLATAKVKCETELLQWSDYSSNFSQMRQWLSEREAKLQQVCAQKVSQARKGQTQTMASDTAQQANSTLTSIGERRATLRRTGSIVQDIVSFEPMILSLGEDSELSSSYRHLSAKANKLYEEQKQTVEHYQQFVDGALELSNWIRASRERLAKCQELVFDRAQLSSQLALLKVLESEQSQVSKYYFLLKDLDKINIVIMIN